MADSFHLTLQPFDQRMTFELCRKQESFGEVRVDHLWLPLPTLYGKSGRRQNNHLALCQAFWQLCRQTGTISEIDVRESYLLARISPFIRDIGSRRVFADSRLRRPSRQNQFDEVLNELLSKGGSDPISEMDFHGQTAAILGPPEFHVEVQNEYRTFCAEWLTPAVERLKDDEEGGVELATNAWRDQMRRVGRHAGNTLRKRIFDVLSYESRAAVHRCYSAVWDEMLLPCFRMKGISQCSSQFLEFWHLDPLRRAVSPADNHFHLFHGHVFGLHPAGAAFIQAPAGRQLLGDWLCAEDGYSQGTCDQRGWAGAIAEANRRQSIAEAEFLAYGRLLQGLLIAIYHYANQRTDHAEERAHQPRILDSEQMNQGEGSAEVKRRRHSDSGDDEQSGFWN